MKVIIAGDRYCTNYKILERAIKESNFSISEVISGGARGSDTLGECFARNNNIPYKVFHADWDNIQQKQAVVKTRINPWNKKEEQYNANAGFVRNEQMAKYADALIALQPNGNTNGTQHMIKMAKKYNLSIYIYEKSKEDYEYQF
jgi:hypothetical protein